MMTIEEFIQTYNEAPFEWIDGRRYDIAFPHMGEENGDNTPSLGLYQYIEAEGLGRAFMETPFIAADTTRPHLVFAAYVPDAMFFQPQRFAEYEANLPDWEGMPLLIVPDLVVKIITSTDPFGDINRKVSGYLEAGVAMVWLVDVEQGTVLTCVAGANSRTVQLTRYSGREIVPCEALPGFSIPVHKLFEG